MSIRILHVVPNMNSGGIENYLMNMFRTIDRTEYKFDFLVHHEAKGSFDDEIERLGGRIFRLPVLDDRNVFKYFRDLKNLFSSESFDIVHGHMASLAYFYLRAAKVAGVPVRIAHSHGASFLRTPKGYAKWVLFKGAKVYSNVRLACSTDAGRYLFGTLAFVVVKNAIDTKRFGFDAETRRQTRMRLGIPPDAIVIGHVGRFHQQKNQAFLIETLREVLDTSATAVLLLVGDGELKNTIWKLVESAGLSTNVKIVGATAEPEQYYSSMDVFALPSIYEGLPLVGVEAQAAGLPCFFSSEVSQEVKLSDLAHFLPLDLGAKVWAKAILDTDLVQNREIYSAIVEDAGYGRDENTRRMQNLYKSLLVEARS